MLYIEYHDLASLVFRTVFSTYQIYHPQAHQCKIKKTLSLISSALYNIRDSNVPPRQLNLTASASDILPNTIPLIIWLKILVQNINCPEPTTGFNHHDNHIINSLLPPPTADISSSQCMNSMCFEEVLFLFPSPSLSCELRSNMMRKGDSS